MNKDDLRDINLDESPEECAADALRNEDESEAGDEQAKETSEAGADPAEGKAEQTEAASGAEDEALEIKYMRLMADFQNFRRRTEKEKSDIYAFANEKIVKEMLDVIDNFERALATDSSDESFKEGMGLILKQLYGVLERAGVSEIEALGCEFDPNFHNAVMTEASDEYESGKVSRVLQKGYILNSRVIRPTMVVVVE